MTPKFLFAVSMLSLCQQRKAQKEAAVLKEFSERLRPRLEATARQIGFDIKAAQEELTAITQETDADKRRTRIEEYARKYNGRYQKLIQASGIDVAKERSQLIAALGLNPAKVKPSDTLILEVQGDDQQPMSTPVEVPPENARQMNQPEAFFSKISFPQFETVNILPPLARPVTWGDGQHSIDLSLGRAGAVTRTVNWVGSSDSGVLETTFLRMSRGFFAASQPLTGHRCFYGRANCAKDRISRLSSQVSGSGTAVTRNSALSTHGT